MEKTQDISLTEILIPFTVVMFVIAVGVILLYLQYKRNIIQKEYEKAILKSVQQDELLKAILVTQEDERKRIAADIHDEIGAAISIIKMNLTLLFQKVAKNEPIPADNAKTIQNLISLSENAITSVRNITHQLMPPQLETFGLIKTLESVQHAINKAGELIIEIQAFNDESTELSRVTALHLYRIIMELINNTIKHARAKSINIRLNFERDRLTVLYQDDGIGISLEKPGNHSFGKGFQTIESRARALEGRVTYPNMRNETGFIAQIELPLNS